MQLQRNRDEPQGRQPGALAPTEAELRANGTNRNSKKRKADSDEEPAFKTKKAKAVDGVPGSFFHEAVSQEERAEPAIPSPNQSNTARPDAHPEEPTPSQLDPLSTTTQPQSMPPPISTHTHSLPTRTSPPDPAPPAASIDEEEWAAFVRDVATPPPTPPATGSGSASALLASRGTITAAPLSAAEIAAQAREEAELQQTKTDDVEAEAENEDAERRLEEEFEEMAGLEERVKVLKEKREALRKQLAETEVTLKELDEEERMMIERKDDEDEVEKDDDDDDGGGEDMSDEDDDGWNNWGR